MGWGWLAALRCQGLGRAGTVAVLVPEVGHSHWHLAWLQELLLILCRPSCSWCLSRAQAPWLTGQKAAPPRLSTGLHR